MHRMGIPQASGSERPEPATSGAMDRLELEIISQKDSFICCILSNCIINVVLLLFSGHSICPVNVIWTKLKTECWKIGSNLIRQQNCHSKNIKISQKYNKLS